MWIKIFRDNVAVMLRGATFSRQQTKLSLERIAPNTVTKIHLEQTSAGKSSCIMYPGCDREENVSVHLLKRAKREMSSGRISEKVSGKGSDQK